MTSRSLPENTGSLISSYRRAQYLVAGSKVPSATEPTEYTDIDPPDDEQIDSDIESAEVGRTPTQYNHRNTVLEWHGRPIENNLPSHDIENLSMASPPFRAPSPIRRGAPSRGSTRIPRLGTRETTPLLRKSVSFSPSPYPRREASRLDFHRSSTSYSSPNSSNQVVLHHRPSQYQRTPAGAVATPQYSYGGQSTFGQSLFNSVAILLGVGMLSEPLAFSYAGWIVGTLLLSAYGFVTCYTAKVLARIILQDPRLYSYADIGRKAFGPRSTLMTAVFFFLELFSLGVVLITLYADSLHTILPEYSVNTYKLWALVVLIPTVFLPLSLLSYASLLGIISTVLIIVVIVVDGLSKTEPPGSLWTPAETSFAARSWGGLGVAFGLFMAGFGGHAVIPSLARDMVDPTQFDVMINWAFAIATFLYAMIGYAGYLMFGDAVSVEVSIDLLRTPGYNPILNKTALWMLVISPLTKFALSTRPINIMLEMTFGLGTTAEGHSSAPAAESNSKRMSKQAIVALERILFVLLAVAVSILLPDFSSMMAFLGSFSAFAICVIGPICAKIALEGSAGDDGHKGANAKRRYLPGFLDAIALGLALVMAVWGTTVAFWV